jgi:colanic acid/amylovoran biosynthesis glycosyltransferase
LSDWFAYSSESNRSYRRVPRLPTTSLQSLAERARRFTLPVAPATITLGGRMTVDACSTSKPRRDAKSLVILPSIGAVPHADGQITITRKFLDGVAEMTRHWPGPVEVILPPLEAATDNLDSIRLDPRERGISIKVIPFDDNVQMTRELQGAGIALASVYYKLNNAAVWCRKVHVPCVYVAEYTLKTRLQILDTEVSNPLVRARRRLWEYGQERRIKAALRLSSGVQCNGTPTYDAYQLICPSSLLFFDGRVERSLLISPEALERRLEALSAGRPLRLAFSGRLIRMKGADHLPLVARELKRRQVPFELTICGDGVLADSLRQQIRSLGLEDCVRMTGVLDFARELVPFVKDNVDAFVCCHRQGDPSCTYIETMSCGVPIIGYANEALDGILRRTPVGSGVPIDDVSALADAIARLHADRESLAAMSRRALDFAADNTFEETFRKRIEHLQGLAQQAEALAHR